MTSSLPGEHPLRRIDAYRRLFPRTHLVFACHAAFPIALTPHLLNMLWVNFQRDQCNTPLKIPWVATADLLLSMLCQQVGGRLFEMRLGVRQVLLAALYQDDCFGEQRLVDLAGFVRAYVRPELEGNDPYWRPIAQAQDWNALAYLDPEQAAQSLAKELGRSILKNDYAEQLRLASIIETLADPLRGYAGLIEYAHLRRGLVQGQAPTAQEASLAGQQALAIPGLETLLLPPLEQALPEEVSGVRLETVSAMTDEHARAEALLQLIPDLPKAQEERALSIAQTIRDEADRVRILSALIPSLPPFQRQVAKETALDALQDISEPQARTQALITLLNSQTGIEKERLEEETLQTMLDFQAVDDRIDAWVGLMPHLSESTRERLLPDVLNTVQKSQSGRAAVETLIALLPSLSPEQRQSVLDQAYKTAFEITNERARVDTLLELLPHLREDRRADAIDWILRTMPRVENEQLRVEAWLRLLPFLPDGQRQSVVSEAIAAAQKIPDEQVRSRLQAELSKYLPAAPEPIQTPVQAVEEGPPWLPEGFPPIGELEISLSRIPAEKNQTSDELIEEGYRIALKIEVLDTQLPPAVTTGVIRFDQELMKAPVQQDVHRYAQRLQDNLFNDVSQQRLLEPPGQPTWLQEMLSSDASLRTIYRLAMQASQDRTLRVRLRIEQNAAELQDMFWESLAGPGEEALFPSGRTVFSRYVPSAASERIPPLSTSALRSLVVVSNPSDLTRYGPMDVALETNTGLQALQGISEVEVLASEPSKPGLASVDEFQNHLAKGIDILYLVCHTSAGQGGFTFVMEGASGASENLGTSELVEMIRKPPLEKRLRLVVLLGPIGIRMKPKFVVPVLAAVRLVEAGVPAVLFFRDRSTAASLEGFLTIFFNELRNQGQVDRAAAAARASLHSAEDWWSPVLVTSLPDGILFLPAPAPQEAPVAQTAPADAVRPGSAETTALEQAYSQLDPLSQQALQALAVFGRPVPPAAVDFLFGRDQPDQAGPAALNRLADLRLAAVNEANLFSIEPSAREFALQRLPPTPSLAELQSRAADFYRQLRTPSETWTSPDDLAPQLAEIDLRYAAGQYDEAAEVLLQIDEKLLRWGDYMLLIEQHERLLDKLSPENQLNNLRTLGTAYDASGEARQAIAIHEQGLQLAREAHDRNAEAYYLGSLGNSYTWLGQHRRASQFFSQAVELARMNSDRYLEAVASSSLAGGFAFLGDVQRAIEYYERALVLARQIDNRQLEGFCLSGQGLCYAALGETPRAIQYYNRSLEIAQQMGDRLSLGSVRLNLAEAWIDQERLDKAAKTAEESAQIGHQMGSDQLSSQAFYTLALARLLSKDLPTALSAIDRARQFHDPTNDHRVLALQGLIARLQNDSSVASQAFTTAITTAEGLLTEEAENYQALDTLALARAGLGDIAEASRAYQGARSVNNNPGVVRRTVRLLEQLEDIPKFWDERYSESMLFA